jgi:O-antigen biosynthesis rhamnosyltransferase
MRVLHFYKTYFPDSFGGIEQFIFQLAHGTAKRGLDVEVLSLSPEVAYEVRTFDNHRVHRVHRDLEIASTGISAAAIRRFSVLAKECDLIHLHFPWPFGDLVYLAAAVSKPTVLTYHSDIVRQKTLAALYRPVMDRFLRSVDSIVATSPNYLESSPVLNRYREKVRVIPIGLDPSTYPTSDAGTVERWRNQVGDKFFLFVGVLRYYKGLHVLLEALNGIDYPLVIVGAGPTESELRTHARRIGLSNVRFLGAISDQDKAAILELSFAVVFPSHLRSEAFGISLLEGAMFGKPMISSEIGTGTSFINVNGCTGTIIPPDNPIALRDALVGLYENPEIAHAMGTNARHRFEQHFTAESMTDAYINLYSAMLC